MDAETASLFGNGAKKFSTTVFRIGGIVEEGEDALILGVRRR
jgi:hypothetical protein